MLKTITLLVIAAAGVALARYAEADDAPGAVLIGGVLVLGAVALVVKAFARKKL